LEMSVRGCSAVFSVGFSMSLDGKGCFKTLCRQSLVLHRILPNFLQFTILATDPPLNSTLHIR
jgi:hypothetical protein